MREKGSVALGIELLKRPQINNFWFLNARYHQNIALAVKQHCGLYLGNIQKICPALGGEGLSQATYLRKFLHFSFSVQKMFKFLQKLTQGEAKS